MAIFLGWASTIDIFLQMQKIVLEISQKSLNKVQNFRLNQINSDKKLLTSKKREKKEDPSLHPKPLLESIQEGKNDFELGFNRKILSTKLRGKSM